MLHLFSGHRRFARFTREAEQRAALRAVASFELAKGLAVLLAAAGLLSLRYREVWDFAGSLLHLLHIHRGQHYSDIFLKLYYQARDARLWVVAVGCVLYSTVRFVEAYGLWNARAWAEWFAFCSGTIYLPFEVYELWRRVTLVRVGILAVNLAIVIYMLFLLQQSAQHRKARPE